MIKWRKFNIKGPFFDSKSISNQSCERTDVERSHFGKIVYKSCTCYLPNQFLASLPIYRFHQLQYSFRFPSVCNSRRSVGWAIGSLWWYHSNFSEELHLQRYGNAGSEKGVRDNFKCCTFCYIELIDKKNHTKLNQTFFFLGLTHRFS